YGIMEPTFSTAGDARSPGPDRPGRSAPAPDLGAAFVVTADVGASCPSVSASVPGAPSGSRSPSASPEGLAGLPPFELRALRIAETGWGAGWELRQAPPRRPWMDQHTHAYHCLPLVVANQWGWQVHFP